MSSDLNNYGQIIQLDLPVDIDALKSVNYNWVQYNPRKKNDRFGCSITSLDGGDSGTPDLDSVSEYNRINKVSLNESNFNVPTVHATPFNYFLNNFKVGRSHYLKLNHGGHFPWHRDMDSDTFRIIYTIQNCDKESLVWLQDDRVLPLDSGRWYYINTKVQHAVVSFSECIFAVFNVLDTRENVKKLKSNFRVR